MTAKIWISIIAGVVIAVTFTVALEYSPWFFPLVVVGIGLMCLGFASLSELSCLRGSVATLQWCPRSGISLGS